MNKDFLAEFLGNQVRARVLRLLTAAGDTEYTLDDIRKKAQIKNAAAVERELNVLVRLGVVKVGALEAKQESTEKKGKRAPTKVWALDREHPYTQALRLFVRDTQQPIDEGVVSELRRAGKLRLVIASGRFMDTEGEHGRIDLVIVGESLNESKVQATLRAIEADRGREILYAVFSPKEFKYRLDVQDRLIRDVLDYPHHVLFDKLNLL